MTKCSDCKGTGLYKGFNIIPEPCQKCNGVTFKELLEKPVANGSQSSQDLKTGCVVYVYDCEWFKADVQSVYTQLNGKEMIRATYPCGEFRILKIDVCWNDTQKRWEHIRAGTPIW